MKFLISIGSIPITLLKVAFDSKHITQIRLAIKSE